MSVSATDESYVALSNIAHRTGENLLMPTKPTPGAMMSGSGFVWYDTGQSHIITNAVFRKCGYTSDEFNQYDTSSDRGCGNATDPNGCETSSTTFGFLTHSDGFNPELMQGTKNIVFDRVGRRFALSKPTWNTVSARQQNWIDVDGSASGQNRKTFMVSGVPSVERWWKVDDNVVLEPQGPLRFIDGSIGQRGLAHIALTWDDNEHSKVGTTICGNGDMIPNTNPKQLWPCLSLGTIRHAGPKFSSGGNIVTATGELVGAVGGFGWILELAGGAPKRLKIKSIEVLPDTPLLLSIPYPTRTSFNITMQTPSCNAGRDTRYLCTATFNQTSSLNQVRTGPGNLYHVDVNTGVLTLRVSQPAEKSVWKDMFYPDLNKMDIDGVNRAYKRFEREGVLLPVGQSYGTHLVIEANCASVSGVYCSGPVNSANRQVCPAGYSQSAYDYCCPDSGSGVCLFAHEILYPE
jgi:hypothetical protein